MSRDDLDAERAASLERRHAAVKRAVARSEPRRPMYGPSYGSSEDQRRRGALGGWKKRRENEARQ